ncbi:hypothetical protein CRG98_005171 [Punica granatum]|uniref:Glutathione S-transferase n=1 Tax=Punica granatum TaxID=22663 RepID=A0A2I0L111_PUNGR|nr:hypothetical protein CRG98_005171 [Punica granatum]
MSISESLIIVQYIDKVWPHKSPLLPSDPYERANARFWADYVDKKIYSAARSVWETTGEAQEAAKKQLINCFRTLEVELGDKTYFGATNLETIAANFNIGEECPKLVEWAKRCMQRESVSMSLADQHKVYEYILEFMGEIQNQPHRCRKDQFCNHLLICLKSF